MGVTGVERRGRIRGSGGIHHQKSAITGGTGEKDPTVNTGSLIDDTGTRHRHRRTVAAVTEKHRSRRDGAKT